MIDLRKFLLRRSICRMAASLGRTKEDEFLSSVPDRVIKVFRHAIRNVPGYRCFLEQRGIGAGTITCFDEFHEQVPILDKQTWFGRRFAEIAAKDRLSDVAAFFSSSGQTGFFSLGTETHAEQRTAALFLEFALQKMFSALERRTLLVNCLPMGVRAHTRTIPVAETSVREDVVLALLNKVKEEFDQVILLGEHLFLKHVVEEGLSQREHVEWKKLRIHVVTGAEFVAENFRTYLASLLGIDVGDPSGGSVNINFGLSEISPSIAHENWHTIQIRRLAYEHSEFRKALMGTGCGFCPTVMQYNPTQFYLETDTRNAERPELLVTVLDTLRCIPIIRYNTGDHARTLTHSEVSGVLRDFGREDLIPPIRLPCLLLWGKCRPFKQGFATVYPEQVKEAIYVDGSVAAALTGNFHIGGGHAAPCIKFQLKEGLSLSDDLIDSLKSQCRDRTGVDLEVRVFPHREFPYGIRHDFERKNRYLD